jgi:amino acid transporter
MESTESYTTSTATGAPLITKPEGVRSYSKNVFSGFREAPSTRHASPTFTVGAHGKGKSYNAKAAAANTATSPLVRRLKGRHLQMIAIGGSIGKFRLVIIAYVFSLLTA